jgi:hypothetical protein
MQRDCDSNPGSAAARVPPRQRSVDWLQLDQLNDMNKYILYTFAQVATTLAGFSGLVVVFRVRGTQAWSSTELRTFWFLLGDSFLVLFFSLLPVPLSLANWPHDALWGLCNALLGSWFITADVLAFLGARRDRALRQATTVRIITPLLYTISVVALVTGIALWLSAFDFIVRCGQAVFVLGLLMLLVFAALEFYRPDVAAGEMSRTFEYQRCRPLQWFLSRPSSFVHPSSRSVNAPNASSSFA